MSDRSSIEWTDATWNPIRATNLTSGRPGWFCEKLSAGCKFCYAEDMNIFRGNGVAYRAINRSRVAIEVSRDALLKPVRWRRPRTIFVCSMTDLFASFHTDAMIDDVFTVIEAERHHTFVVLTKRPDRMRSYLIRRLASRPGPLAYRPIPNLWIGTSCEDQPTANARLPWLVATPATHRVVSCEPLLGALNLAMIEPPGHRATIDVRGELHAVIVGGESGRRARPMYPQWPRQLRDQCAAVGLPFEFKQWGRWAPIGTAQRTGATRWVTPDGGLLAAAPRLTDVRAIAMRPMSKKAAGRHLDGVTHDLVLGRETTERLAA